ncbi:putative signal recognition particle protein [Trypanosoma cruzi]|uniref:Signal recognition particle subunit SRP72 n=1 Tax=Trypanosoma cruzi Dm28c TaxID=1416333 RepID=V5BJ44_TRYCR|nr:signal recognition particle protein [Trypanosoma cruzi Dm28c]KAF8282346.1 putative signal recognition particle protein [Trypanosoma cruzi]PBJ70127.1 signal recognition particle protein [Trypanosoma cruzi cruzi]RNF25538.1 putative signal recognition particle protein [Trypanosoma cruzi]
MSDVAKWEKQLERLLVDGSDSSKILTTIEKILSVNPKHVFALRCKVVCFLHQDKHAAALTVLDQIAVVDPALPQVSQDYAFQKAYCLYRALEHRQAQHVLMNDAPHTAEHVPSRHLLAQLHYHLEEYEVAAGIYEALLTEGKFRDEHEKTELQTNYAAACSAIDAQRTQSIVRSADEKNADLLYNAATAQLEVQEYAAALQTLQQAESLCAKAYPTSRLRSFQDACSRSDTELRSLLDVKGSPERLFFNDVAIIWVQTAYVHYAMHNEEDATALLNLVLRYRPSSAVTLAVASINWTAIQRHRDFFDTHRKLKSAQNPAVNNRLTSRQRLLVRYNTAMLLLHTGNFNAFKRQVELIANEYPDSDLTHSLKLALAVRESKKKRQPDEKTLTEYLKNYQQSVRAQKEHARNPSVGKLLPLIAAQIFLENGDLEHAIESLSSAPEEIRKKPCTLMTLATWKVQLGDVKGAKQLLTEFAGAAAKGGTVVKPILFWAVQFLTARGLYTDAADVIRDMQSALPVLQNDKEARALLALCLSHYDMQAARTCMETIPEAGFTGTQTEKKLLASSIAEATSQQPSRKHIEALGYHRISADGHDGNNNGAKVKRSRRRPMRRPPKNADARLDPERWIPMSHRSYIKDLPERRKRELKRLRAIEQEQKRHEAEKRKAAAH